MAENVLIFLGAWICLETDFPLLFTSKFKPPQIWFPAMPLMPCVESEAELSEFSSSTPSIPLELLTLWVKTCPKREEDELLRFLSQARFALCSFSSDLLRMIQYDSSLFD